MPGTASSGPGMMHDVQSRNAQNQRGGRSDAGGSHPNNGQGGWHLVHAEPAAGAGFTFERATKIQCVRGVQYAVAPDSEESAYFVKHSSLALRSAATQPAPAPVSELLREVGASLEAEGDGLLSIRYMEHTQIKFVPNPDISSREPPANDISYEPPEFENYQLEGADGKTLHMVQAPDSEGGKHYEVLNQRSWDFAVRIVGEMSLGVRFSKDKSGAAAAVGEIDYAFMLRLGRRGPNHTYTQPPKPNEIVICVSVGEINPSTGNFVAWTNGAPNTDLVCVKDAPLQNLLFSQLNARGGHWPVWQAGVAEAEEDVMAALRASLHGSRGARQRFQLEAHEGRMCVSHVEKGSKEPEWIAVCNFELLSVDGLYQFVEDDAGDPYFKVLCRSLIAEDGEGDVYLAADDTLRTPRTRGKQHLIVEVLVQPGNLKSNADVSKLFQKYHIRLLSSIMTPDMLRCWMAEQESPPTTRCIVRFGELF